MTFSQPRHSSTHRAFTDLVSIDFDLHTPDLMYNRVKDIDYTAQELFVCSMCSLSATRVTIPHRRGNLVMHERGMGLPENAYAQHEHLSYMALIEDSYTQAEMWVYECGLILKHAQEISDFLVRHATYLEAEHLLSHILGESSPYKKMQKYARMENGNRDMMTCTQLSELSQTCPYPFTTSDCIDALTGLRERTGGFPHDKLGHFRYQGVPIYEAMTEPEMFVLLQNRANLHGRDLASVGVLLNLPEDAEISNTIDPNMLQVELPKRPTYGHSDFPDLSPILGADEDED